MQSLDVRLKALETEAAQLVEASAKRIFDWCQTNGFAVAPVGQLNTAQWLATVATDTLSAILNNHTPETQNAKP
jgi:hypothetical protein